MRVGGFGSGSGDPPFSSPATGGLRLWVESTDGGWRFTGGWPTDGGWPMTDCSRSPAGALRSRGPADCVFFFGPGVYHTRPGRS